MPRPTKKELLRRAFSGDLDIDGRSATLRYYE
jgi:hypothetical protein